jgi:universal stress protein A
MKTIVLGFDDSAEAGRARDRAAELARSTGARVLVASVAPTLQPAGHGIGPYDPADPPERYAGLARETAEWLTGQGVEATDFAGTGNAGEAILELARTHTADLIVIGMSHHPAIARFLGGVSEDVVHHAECDVLLVR